MRRERHSIILYTENNGKYINERKFSLWGLYNGQKVTMTMGKQTH